MTADAPTDIAFTRPVPIRRGQGVALWRQIADRLRSEIASGRYPVDARLPTEPELSVRFGVNRLTVRRAIEGLARDGLVSPEQGRGTFVRAQPIPYAISERTRFSEIIGRAGRVADGTIIDVRRERASPDLAEQLELSSNTRVWRIEMVRGANGVPISSSVLNVPEAMAPTLDRDIAVSGSITAALTVAGFGDYRRRQTRIGATLASDEDAIRLQIDPGEPILTVDSLNVDAAGKPLQTGSARFVASRVQLIVDQGH